jgi:hypothetical protein
VNSGRTSPSFSLSRIHPGEWLVGLFGLALLAGLLLPWDRGSSALSSPGFLDVVLGLIAVAAVLLPLIVALSARTDVPIAYETFLWPITLLFGLVLIVKAFFPPDGGFDGGFWLALAATLALGFALWRSVDREY